MRDFLSSIIYKWVVGGYLSHIQLTVWNRGDIIDANILRYDSASQHSIYLIEKMVIQVPIQGLALS